MENESTKSCGDKDSLRSLWSIPIATVYLYAISVLTQYGYNSYFGIPPHYIEASLTTNIVLFYQFAYLTFELILQTPWWLWLMLITVVIIGYFIYKAYRNHKKILYCLVIIFLGVSLLMFEKFGESLASHLKTLPTISAECLSLGDENYYVAVTYYGEDVLIAPVKRNTHKADSTFFVRNLSQLPCPVAWVTME